MAILDERTEFADATSVGTPNNTTVNVGDIIDMGIAARNPGHGQPVYLVIQVTTTITSGGSATVEFQLASDATSTIAVDGTQTIHYKSDAFAVASLAAGFELCVPLPIDPDGSNAYERYLAFQINETAGQALTAGNVNAFLTLDPRGWKSYADASN
jgi:hypothetical protein